MDYNEKMRECWDVCVSFFVMSICGVYESKKMARNRREAERNQLRGREKFKVCVQPLLAIASCKCAQVCKIIDQHSSCCFQQSCPLKM